MPVEIDDATKKRLIYVKKLYLHGREHIAYQTEFDRMIALHHLDNAVELLLRCVATRYGVTFRRSLFVTFPTLWDEVNQRFPLPKKTEMFRLHNFRSNVQHWGISPFSSEVVNRFEVYVSDFIREVLEQAFGLNFEELFMSSLVEDKTLRKILTIAEKAFEKGEYTKCVRFADAAFNEAFWEQRKNFGFFVPFGKKEFLEETVDIVHILAMGIGYRDYRKYKNFAPRATWDDEKENIRYPRSLSEVFRGKGTDELEKEKYSRENAVFSLNFVLDCLLRWHL